MSYTDTEQKPVRALDTNCLLRRGGTMIHFVREREKVVEDILFVSVVF